MAAQVISILKLSIGFNSGTAAFVVSIINQTREWDFVNIYSVFFTLKKGSDDASDQL